MQQVKLPIYEILQNAIKNESMRKWEEKDGVVGRQGGNLFPHTHTGRKKL